MHRLYMDAEVWCEVPNAADVWDQVTGGVPCSPAVIDIHEVRCRLTQFAQCERGVTSRAERPRVRMGGRLSSEVAGVELGDGGLEVVQVERDVSRQQLVGVSLNDIKKFDAGFPKLRISQEDRRTT